MAVIIEPEAPAQIRDVDITPRGPVFPSPTDWRDQVLYFLLPDRFSDGQEAARPLYDWSNPEEFKVTNKREWMGCGKVFQGGMIKGITSKLDYLKGLGVTALWVGPVWRQRPDLQTYHGYGIQNFLDVDPRFGTRQDLRDLVDAAHVRGMYVILDIIYNHTGNNWFYGGSGEVFDLLPYRFSPPYSFGGWRSAAGMPTEVISSVDDGAWPADFQNLEWYTRAGYIGRWDPDSWEDRRSPDTEFRRGDFFDLKDLNLNRSDSLNAIIRVYQYWIALTDCDGFRIDTVKHISFEASRRFCGAIREYAESIGKENFWLLGEVTGGGQLTRDYLDIFGRNLDAALDIGQPAAIMTGVVKGQISPSVFFDQFSDHDILGGHRETGRYHVSILDDHDMVGRGGKHRFSAFNQIPARYDQVAHAVGLQLTTLGIPCIYYGTEQALDGSESDGDPAVDPGWEDRYIREAMFGASFGAFRTNGCHFFNPDHPSYQRIAAISRIRNGHDLVGLALRRGRQYQRETTFLGRPFSLPDPGELVAWSRILCQQEVLIALNTHGTESRGADITVDMGLHSEEPRRMKVLYHSSWPVEQLHQPPEGQSVPVEDRFGRATVRVDLPPAGMAILA